jgi:hypothetical protein
MSRGKRVVQSEDTIKGDKEDTMKGDKEDTNTTQVSRVSRVVRLTRKGSNITNTTQQPKRGRRFTVTAQLRGMSSGSRGGGMLSVACCVLRVTSYVLRCVVYVACSGTFVLNEYTHTRMHDENNKRHPDTGVTSPGVASYQGNLDKEELQLMREGVDMFMSEHHAYY